MMVQWDFETEKIVQETMSKPLWLTIAGALERLLGLETVELYGRKYIRWGDYHWRLYYSRTGNPYMGHVLHVVDFFKEKEGRFLDVGCGEGLIMKRIEEESKLECYGIDSSPLAIEFAHQHKIMNCEAISFEQFKSDDSYDFIFMGDFLEHVEDPEAALQKAKGLLVEDGLIFISFPIQAKMGMDDLHFFTEPEIKELVETTFTIESYDFQKDVVRTYIIGRKPKSIEKFSEVKEKKQNGKEANGNND